MTVRREFEHRDGYLNVAAIVGYALRRRVHGTVDDETVYGLEPTVDLADNTTRVFARWVIRRAETVMTVTLLATLHHDTTVLGLCASCPADYALVVDGDDTAGEVVLRRLMQGIRAATNPATGLLPQHRWPFPATPVGLR